MKDFSVLTFYSGYGPKCSKNSKRSNSWQIVNIWYKSYISVKRKDKISYLKENTVKILDISLLKVWAFLWNAQLFF